MYFGEKLVFTCSKSSKMSEDACKFGIFSILLAPFFLKKASGTSIFADFGKMLVFFVSTYGFYHVFFRFFLFYMFSRGYHPVFSKQNRFIFNFDCRSGGIACLSRVDDCRNKVNNCRNMGNRCTVPLFVSRAADGHRISFKNEHFIV